MTAVVRELFRGALAAERRPIYRLPGFARDAAGVVRRLPDVGAIWFAHRVDREVREEVMVAVASANRCRWCSFLHGEWARQLGVPDAAVSALATRGLDALEDPIAAAVRPALAGEEMQLPSRQEAMAAASGAPAQRDLRTVAEVMNLANRTANTFDALLARLQGHPHPDGRAADEVVLAALFGPSILAALAVSAVAWRRSPIELARQFTHVSRELDAA